MGQSPNAASIPGQRRRRWANIEKVSGQCHVFAWGPAAYYTANPVLEWC